MENNTTSGRKIEEGFPGQKMIVLSPDRIRKIERNALARNLYPTAIGYYPHAAFHERDRKAGSEQYILLYCTNGKGWIKVKGKEFTLSSNSYYILPKGVPHSYGSSQKEPWSIYWLHFAGKTADLLYSRFEASFTSAPTIPYDEASISLFHNIVVLSESDLNPPEMELLYGRLIQFLFIFIYRKEASPRQEQDIIAKSIDFMKNNLDRNFTVKELAELVSYSPSHYSELFREKTGYAPIQYFLQLKIQKSCQYLYFSPMPIKEICKKIGIEDQYYFSRMFKKQMNMSPREYRKSYRV